MNVSQCLSSPWPVFMIAQWENECISVSVLSLARVYDSPAGEIMYFTVCPLCGPAYDSPVGEIMYITVCSLCSPSSVPGDDRGFFPD